MAKLDWEKANREKKVREHGHEYVDVAGGGTASPEVGRSQPSLLDKIRKKLRRKRKRKGANPQSPFSEQHANEMRQLLRGEISANGTGLIRKENVDLSHEKTRDAVERSTKMRRRRRLRKGPSGP